MGEWGVGVFDNDSAPDWAYGLEGKTDTAYIADTLDRVLEVGEDYLEAPDAEEGLAAAEAVARIVGRWGVRNSYTETMDKWIESVKPTAGPDLVQKAARVVSRVLREPSEALELWAESDEFEAWKAVAVELRNRLGV